MLKKIDEQKPNFLEFVNKLNEPCPNLGTAELMTGSDFSPLFCKICQKNTSAADEQKDCPKLAFFKGTQQITIKKSHGNGRSFFKIAPEQMIKSDRNDILKKMEQMTNVPEFETTQN
ncbi:MAG: hypothetical protein LBQ05_01505 [Christensenellaceae bacterium]|nr:hypothetical protein [Christensenellaceae bacterium]